ncbi:PTS sugar transporter subunit IIA [Lactobacillus kullabergensis]|uniref:PTS sugar transporter subunit IIA n=1 Tax=Lactobacillus kullabergensis TaxID=1218493 RepID=UPI0022483893|nr:PTS sugar transporter subunit IIA [Lactobacillus kullabergensis]MCX0290230.1 PTS sugar transporter subunit IIA [Lactobacillus kullabergensis]
MNEILLESCDFDVTDQKAAFQIIAGIVASKMFVSKKTVLKSLSTREKIANTALVKGIAIPHVILESDFTPWLLILKSQSLIADWDCLDNSKVNTLICLIVPRIIKKFNKSFKEIIQIINKLADENVISEINKAESATEIVQILKR